MRPRIKAPDRMPLWPHMKAMVMCMPTPGLLRFMLTSAGLVTRFKALTPEQERAAVLAAAVGLGLVRG